MKIAVAGKGGAGKTTIAGTLARVMAERVSGSSPSTTTAIRISR